MTCTQGADHHPTSQLGNEGIIVVVVPYISTKCQVQHSSANSAQSGPAVDLDIIIYACWRMMYESLPALL